MSESVAKKLGRRIKALRQARGLTQAEAAERSGYDPVTISRFERGEYAPSVEALEALGCAIDAPIEAFFHFEDTGPSAAELRAELIAEIVSIHDSLQLAELLKAVRKVKAKG